jgi:Peptidase A4 family
LLSQSLEEAVGKGYRLRTAIVVLATAGLVATTPVLAPPLSGASGPATVTGSPMSGHGPGPARWVTRPGDSPATSPVVHADAAGDETLNWSGELESGTTFTEVTGSWDVPEVATSQPSEYSSTWIGIGGGSESSTGLLQLGTEQDAGSGATTYYAWVEMLPAAAYPIVDATTGTPAPVTPGDHMQVTITESAADLWHVEMEDTTQGWQFTHTYHYTGTDATAEWIEEATTVNTSISTLADFHSVRFTDMQVAGADASNERLVPITMTNDDGTVIASPGPVETATTRSVTVSYVTPATPPPAGTGSGYDLVGADGGVFVFDPPGHSGGFHGSLPGIGVDPNKPIVGMVATTNGQGYFLVAADGGVFSFGNAPFLGSLPGLHVVPNRPIAGLIAASTDRGYFLVGQDGGVFAFGDVPYLGSLPGEGISVDDIVGIAATPSGSGYWLIASTGQVYAFGAAQHLGTAVGSGSPVSAIAGTPTGGGYWVTTRDGAVFAFGNAKTFGTLPAMHVTPNRPVIGIVPTAGTGGYWLVGSDGGIFTFGDAAFIGALPSIASVDDIVGAVTTVT